MPVFYGLSKVGTDRARVGGADLRDRVVEAAVGLYSERGIRFTMDDLARRLRMSKRTIYEQVGTKEEVLAIVIDDAFANITARENRIIADPELDVVAKLKKLLTVMSDRAEIADPSMIRLAREAYPAVYDRIVYHLRTGWEQTLGLVEESVDQGRLRAVRATVLREILLGALDGLLREDVIAETGLTPEQALAEVVDIVFAGLEPRP